MLYHFGVLINLNFKMKNLISSVGPQYGLYVPLVLCLLYISSVPINGLPELFDNIRADSKMLYLTQNLAQIYLVAEFINRQDGSIKISVANLTETDSQDDSKDYYRIRENITGYYDGLDDKVVLFNASTLLCSVAHTSNWYLFELTNVLDALFTSDQLNTARIKSDRTSIGPITLLQIVYENAGSFLLDSRAFDDTNLYDTYYFSMILDLSPNQKVKFICTLPAQHANIDDDKIQVGKTRLSQIISNVHVSKVAIVFSDQENGTSKRVPLERKKSSDLLLLQSQTEYDILLVSYTLIQELSLVKHFGSSGGSKISFNNPFILPGGAGCGLVSQHSPFYVLAHRFSGQFEALHFADTFYIAYDQETNHMRYDSIGEHKIIYSLNHKRATMVADSSNLMTPIGEDYQDQNHCVQAYFRDMELGEDKIFNSKTMADILGFGQEAGLFYLGTTTVDDGAKFLFHVFEREITFRQIPAILLMNLSLKPRANGRFFLVYYFVNEQLNGNDDIFQDNAYESMWLKKMELHSRNEVSKYTFTVSRLKFNKFTWSLETLSEDTRDRQTKLLHPVRLFDTLECSSIHDQIQLEMLLTQLKDTELLGNWQQVVSKNNSYYKTVGELLTKQTNLIEESLMAFISKRTDFARSLIGDLDFLLLDDVDNDPESTKMIVKAKLIKPLNYKYKRNLLGWVKTFESLRYGKKVTLTKKKSLMTRHECLLSLGTRFNDKNKINMLYCPNVGCGYIQNLTSIEYIKASGQTSPITTEIYFSMCEIYQLQKQVDFITGEFRNIYSIDQIRKSLDKARVSIELNQVESESDIKKTFHALVSQLSLIKGIMSQDSLDELLFTGSCLTKSIVSPPASGDQQELDNIKVVQFNLDKHHSQVHCHKACLMYAFCMTYTYNRASKQCSLSNISKNIALRARDPEDSPSILNNLVSDTNCSMYAPNSLLLYELKTETRYDSPTRIWNSDKYLTISSLIDCAQLCHVNELTPGKQDHCRSFKYLRLNSVCVLEASNYKTYYVKEDANLINNSPNKFLTYDQWKDIVGIDQLHQFIQIEQFQRDYAQYYTIKKITKIQLNESIDNDSNFTQLATSTVLYNIDRDVCLRECTIVNPDCVMVDYCNIINTESSYTSQTKSCHMYHIRSPFTFKNYRLNEMIKLENDNESSTTKLFGGLPLNSLETKFYIQGKSNGHNVTTKLANCQHYYLNGDNLYLKRQLAQSSGTNWTDDTIVNEIGQWDWLISKNFVEQAKKFAQAYSYNQSSGSLFSTLALMIGISFGLVMFIYQWRISSLFDWTQLVAIIRNRERVFGKRRTERSTSQVEFNEMVDIGIDA